MNTPFTAWLKDSKNISSFKDTEGKCIITNDLWQEYLEGRLPGKELVGGCSIETKPDGYHWISFFITAGKNHVLQAMKIDNLVGNEIWSMMIDPSTNALVSAMETLL